MAAGVLRVDRPCVAAGVCFGSDWRSCGCGVFLDDRRGFKVLLPNVKAKFVFLRSRVMLFPVSHYPEILQRGYTPSTTFAHATPLLTV